MDLALLLQIAVERADRWSRAGLDAEVFNGPATDKPASWLVLKKGDHIGQLTVWVSGEAEMDWGTLGQAKARHYELDSAAALAEAVSDLEAAISN